MKDLVVIDFGRLLGATAKAAKISIRERKNGSNDTCGDRSERLRLVTISGSPCVEQFAQLKSAHYGLI